MTVTVRPRGPHVQYDIRFRWPDGTPFRERANAPVTGRAAAKRWAEDRERALLAAGKPAAEKPCPVVTLAEFFPRVITDHYEANRKKPSTIATAKILFRVHLAPALGGKPCSAIDDAAIAALKGSLVDASPKTVNNVLSVLSRTLRCAQDWGVWTGPLPKFGLLRTESGAMDWYEIPVYRRLVEAATLVGHAKLVLVLLAGSAGLRRGEIIALRWTDIDLDRRMLTVSRSIWQGRETTPKGGRRRTVPLTEELHAALMVHRRRNILRSDRVLFGDKVDSTGAPAHLSSRIVRNWMTQAQRRAGLETTGGIHVLRHTFCSHLAIAGVAAKAIQELAGHADLKTTMRYMHLSPANRTAAIDALGRLYEVGETKRATGT